MIIRSQMPPPNTSDSLWMQIEPEPMSGCWIWLGQWDRDGYGKVSWSSGKSAGREKHYVHRVLYGLYRGVVPDGLELDHLCRLHACCNPWHLEAVTHRENLLRGKWGRRRTHCLWGHPYDVNNTRERGRVGGRICRACDRRRALMYFHRGHTIILLLFTAILAACATAGARPLPVVFCPPRPQLTDAQERLTDAGLVWLRACLEASRLNCVQLRALREEDPLACDQGLR